MEEDSQPLKNTTLADVVSQYMLAKKAERLSLRTLETYDAILRKFVAYTGPETPFRSIGVVQIRTYLGSLQGVTNKTVLNVHITLSSLWTYAVADGYAFDHVVRRVTAPKPEERDIIPYTDDEIKLLLGAVGQQVHHVRNRAILLVLLDTGIRATELCSLTISDLRGSDLHIFGKGAKERTVPMSKRTMKALLDYLSPRGRVKVSEPIFAVDNKEPLKRHTLRKFLDRLGQKAGVVHVHAHRFRHTFAVSYLRNGGDAISLQKLLGHSTLEMVERYVHLAKDDISKIHGRASPVENLRL